MDGGALEAYNPASSCARRNGIVELNKPPREISYHEYRTIAQLLQAHAAEHEDRLRAMIAFGDLVAVEGSVDIDLLEIVEGWQGKRLWPFSSTAELPLRGRLRLYFLTPEEFEDPAVIQDPEERKWVEDLLRDVRRGYEIIMDRAPGWVYGVLDRPRTSSTASAPPSGVGRSDNPLVLTPRG
jgi:hypothetical protein